MTDRAISEKIRRILDMVLRYSVETSLEEDIDKVLEAAYWVGYEHGKKEFEQHES